MFDFSLESLAQPEEVKCNTFSGSKLKDNKPLLDRLLVLWGQLAKAEEGYNSKYRLEELGEYNKEFWTKRLQGCPEICVISEKDVVIGMALVRGGSFKNSYFVSSVVIDDAHRHKGYGKRLMQYIVENRPGENAFLNVNVTNPAGMALYKSLGFTPFMECMIRKGEGKK